MNGPATQKPIVDPRTLLGLDQLRDVLSELEIAIAWADKSVNRNQGLQPVVYGRPVRWMCELLKAARENLTPAPSSKLPAIIADYRRDEAERIHQAEQTAPSLSVPRQSAPAFASKAGVR